MLERIVIATWRTRARRATMHATASFAPDSGRPTWQARSGLGTAA
jgi:hypothetical protein